VKLLRTLRLDPSDTLVFPSAAPPGEWAIPGGFVFGNVDPASLQGKDRAAFRNGFLGVPSFSWSTLAQIVEANEQDRAAAIELLAQGMLERFGAPDMSAARRAAFEEVDFIASLCEPPAATVIALRRSAENGTIRESFRRLQRRRAGPSWQAFSFAVEPADEPQDNIDLAALARGPGQ
jgi:Family of unknown function (DUF6505)